MRITTVYDNETMQLNLASAWGFACLVDDDVLFDTGGDGRRLLSNMAGVGIDPAGIQMVVLSHAHGDHTGGLARLLATGVRPTVYVPRSFPRRFKAEVRSATRLVEVRGPAEIWPGIHTTGEMDRGIVEQALVVKTKEGLAAITGCAHPGIVRMVRRAKEIIDGEVTLVMGGFHLGGASLGQIEGVIADFRDLGVQRVAPCHCTGARAMRAFASEFGDAYIQNGVGRVIIVNSTEER
jgi:7,8-dihydropterin-6-yl-methyl-4-(beta-D-ribofuranosyl)aminobenzene 5'-phosphate synthase